MRTLQTFLSALLLLGSTALHAEPATELRERLDLMDSLQGEFTQTLIDSDGEVLEESHGTFAMARPGLFDWHTHEPFEQRLVSDHEKIWLYDPDLKQVTVRDFDSELQDTPALILSDRLEQLTGRFDIEQSENTDGLTVFTLTPKKDDDLFAALELHFDGALLRAIHMHDDLGQVTEFKLSDLERNVDIDPERFRFEAPEGVDVLVDQ